MADFNEIIQEINTNLPDNNTQAITAAKLRTTLIDMCDATSNYLNEIIGGTTTQHIVETYSVGYDLNPTETLRPANNPIIISKNYSNDIHITKIKCSIGVAGNLWIGYVTNEEYIRIYNLAGYDTTSFNTVALNEITVLNITSTGNLEISVDINLPAGSHLAFGKWNQANAAQFNWIPDGEQNPNYEFVFRSSPAGYIRKNTRPIGFAWECEYEQIIADEVSILRQFLASTLAGKKISILGDSISTFQGWIPSNNVSFYPRSGNNVTNVNDTWWKQLIDALGMRLEVNNSWSGSRVTGTDSSSGVTRASLLGTNPDIIIVWMGINDFNNEVGIGTWDGTTALPTSRTTFREAYAIMLNTILSTYPTTKVYCCTLPDTERSGASTNPPEINDAGVALKTWNDAIRDVANAMQVEIIELSKCGIHWHNLNIYTADELHPNKAGMDIITNFLIHNLDNAIDKRY